MKNTIMARRFEDLASGIEHIKDEFEGQIGLIKKMRVENLCELRELLRGMETMINEMRSQVDEFLKEKIERGNKIEWGDYFVYHSYRKEKWLDIQKAREFLKEQELLDKFLIEKEKDMIVFRRKNGNGTKKEK